MESNAAFEADFFSGDLATAKPMVHTTQIDSSFQNFEYGSGKTDKEKLNNGEGEGEEEEDSKKPNSSSTKRCMKRLMSLMLSHLGTFIIVCSYVVMGGFLFTYLEFENEISSCVIKYEKYVAKRNEAVDRVYNVAQAPNATSAKTSILRELNTFGADVNTLGVDPELDCSTLGKSSDNAPSWNTVNAGYFCMTIVTTIGYGHISPATMWGQIVCMIYSILGIPLMLLFLTKIGEPTAMLFRSFYLNIFCCKCFVKKLPHERQLFARMKQSGQQTSWQSAEEGSKQPPAKFGDLNIVEEEFDDDDEDEEDEVVNIPITVTIILLVLYIVLGAAVFRIWEKDWTLVEGTYFSFITLSTIGFGDYVPGRDGPFDDPSVIVELLVGSVYCLFGLAMLSMCINLIQDEIQAKFQWLGQKIGVVKRVKLEESDEEDDSDDSDSDDSDSQVDSDGERSKSDNGTTLGPKSAKSVSSDGNASKSAFSQRKDSSFA